MGYSGTRRSRSQGWCPKLADGPSAQALQESEQQCAREPEHRDEAQQDQAGGTRAWSVGASGRGYRKAPAGRLHAHDNKGSISPLQTSTCYTLDSMKAPAGGEDE